VTSAEPDEVLLVLPSRYVSLTVTVVAYGLPRRVSVMVNSCGDVLEFGATVVARLPKLELSKCTAPISAEPLKNETSHAVSEADTPPVSRATAVTVYRYPSDPSLWPPAVTEPTATTARRLAFELGDTGGCGPSPPPQATATMQDDSPASIATAVRHARAVQGGTARFNMTQPLLRAAACACTRRDIADSGKSRSHGSRCPPAAHLSAWR
jgi:hypothetical protein